MKIGIVGAGKVGCALAFSLSDCRFEISGVYSRNPVASEFIARRLGRDISKEMQQVVAEADLIFISVSDSAISMVAQEISEVCSTAEIKDRIFLHCSGALTSDSLKPIALKGGVTGSLHPIQTFADKESAWKGMFNIYFGFEGMPIAEKIASDLVKALEASMLVIDAGAKPLYHAAACVISNYTATLSQVAGSLLQAVGIDRAAGMQALNPLLMNTARNIGNIGSAGALTGPISRGDYDTIAGHISAMESNKKIDRESIALYKAIGRATVLLAIEKGSIGRDAAAKLLERLE